MVFSTRQRAALDMILRQGRGELTLGQIGSRVGVSGRTIARELARMAPELRRSYGLVLAGKSGQGLRVIGEPERIRDCLAEIESDRPRELGPEDRRRLLALLLLEADGVIKLLSLESELRSGTAAVRRDLEELRPWLESSKLTLSLRRGIGVILEGEEQDKRLALSSIIMDAFGEVGILALIGAEGDSVTRPTDDPCRDAALRLAPAALFKQAEAALAELPRTTMLSLAPRDYLGLVIHLAVCAARKSDDHEIDGSVPTVGRAAEQDGAMQMARLAIEGLARKTGQTYGKGDLLSVYSYLKGAKPERPGAAFLGEIDIAALAGLRNFIAVCGEAYGRPFSDDAALRDGLAAHWGPALYRLRNKLPIRNPLLVQIRSEYGPLFDAIKAAAERCYPQLDIGDDEIGYLAMHFGSSLERRSGAAGRFRALVVCSAGIGSARMLASRIKAELPEIDIVASLSWFDIQSISPESCDILVSTIPLPIPPEDYILVNPLLPPEGIAALKAFLATRRDSLSSSRGAQERIREGGSFGDMKAMNERLAAAIALLERLRVFGPGKAKGEDTADWEGFLAAAVDRCSAEGLVRDPALVLRDLELRSRDRGILLPNSSLLFLHARSSGLESPSVTIHEIGGMPDAPNAHWERRPSRLVLMLAPPGLGDGAQDILNEISSSLLDPSAVEALETGDEALIRIHYTRHLDRYARSSRAQGV